MDKSIDNQKISQVSQIHKHLIENLHEGIIVSQDGLIKFINSTILKNTGYSEDDILGSSIVKFVHPEDRDTLMEYYNERLAGKKRSNMNSFRAVKKDGSIIWFAANSVVIEWERRNAILSILYDITESKLLEEKFRQNEQLFKTIFEQSPSGIFTFNTDYVVTQCNAQLAELLNSSIDKIIGFNLKELKYKDIIPHFSETLEGKHVLYEGLYDSTTGNSKLWALLRLSPIRDSEEKLIGGLGIVDDFTSYKKAEEALKESQQQFVQIIDFLPDPTFAIDINGKVIIWNKSMEEMTGIKAEEMLGKDNYEYAVPFYGYNRPMLIDMVLNPSKDIKMNYISYNRTSEDTLIAETFSNKLGIYLWGKARLLYDINGNIVGAIESIRDLTIIKESQRELIYQKKCYEALFKNSSDAIVFFDRDHKVIDINGKFTELFGYKIEECKGKDVDELIANSQTYSSAKYITETVFKGRYIETEAIRYTKEKKPIEVRIKAVLVKVDNEIVGGYGIYSNISDRKQYERQLEFLSIHDQLTGLHNRAFYEEQITLLSESEEHPITIISVDMDGLKLVNDTLGHNKGDELLKACGDVLKKSLRTSDILARIGGDEFAIILLNTNEAFGEKILERIRSNVNIYNTKHPELQLHISMGIATAGNKNVSLIETYKKADDLMYRDKLSKRNSARSQILNTLMAALAERDYITSGHAQRVRKLCMMIGEKLNLSSKQLADLALLAEVHDLGKVGIPDKILFKPGPLTKEEWEIMCQHPEKGYRIALSAPDLSGIADLILKHHEKWNGKGYPLGLKELNIPIECRILSIVDAFDAMTNDRPYSSKKSKDEAIDEIKRCAGTQFDPDLVEVFLAVI